MGKYSMNGAQDILRLEKQNEQKAYDLSEEIKHFSFDKGDCILDAGCGSGLVTRAIFNMNAHQGIKFEACDYSDIAIEGANNYFLKEHVKVRTFVSDLEKINSENEKYNKVICRYVLEHMKDPLIAVSEFHRVLKKGGKAFIIDLDGILFNIQTDNQTLNAYLLTLKNNFKFDLFIGRKIPSLMIKAGFRDVKWEASVMSFNSVMELEMEVSNYEMRLNLARTVISEALGSQKLFEDFKVLYLKELLTPGNTLFYNKFFVTGTK